MRIDGYAILAVDEKGDKAVVKDYCSHDERLHQLVQWGDMSMEEVLLPDGLSDCLVMVFFSYHSYPDGPWEAPHSEYAEDLNIEQFVIMQSNYKEFEREQISFLITHDGYVEYPRQFEDDEEQWMNELIEEWEMLHDADFEVHPRYKRQAEQSTEAMKC